MRASARPTAQSEGTGGGPESITGQDSGALLRLISWCLGCALALQVSTHAAAADYRERGSADEVIYFLLVDRFANGDASNDRGGLGGDRLVSGFDPTDKYFYHGGDLQGLTERLDYIAELGATAVWLSPIFKNKPVQAGRQRPGAGYHGYWITDFTRVDPHFGSNADLAALIGAAHARGLKVYLDIVTNHTADVIAYRECAPGNCRYRSLAQFPYSRSVADGSAINAGFAGEQVSTPANFARLTRPDYAYTPFVPEAEQHSKVPEWLNDPVWYHNRGDTTYEGESRTFGDFAGLDDLMTEHPRVVAGFIDIYGRWIDEFGIDGMRVDTAKHVNPGFWQAFVPAMLARAKARGIEHFHVFSEVAQSTADPLPQVLSTRVDAFPSALDFALRAALIDSAAAGRGTDGLARVFAADVLYAGGEAGALSLPTFISNHDQGRFAYFARRAQPRADSAELLRRTQLAHALLFTLRGVPVIYAGDEQGFIGDGDDADAREDMFASAVASYNDNPRLGVPRLGVAGSERRDYDRSHPLFTTLRGLAGLRRNESALRRGTQVIRHDDAKAGLFAFSRIDAATGRELLMVFNTATRTLRERIAIDPRTARLVSLHGECAPAPVAPGSYALSLGPLDYIICAALPALRGESPP
jgi:neopullulanase